MIQLIVDGHAFSQEDSCQYIEFKVFETFSNFFEFIDCQEIQNSTYWGEYNLIGTEADYYKWIMQIAEKVLKK